jgi:xylulokinase
VTLVAGVDSSTQSTKVLIVDPDSGEVVASGTAGHPATSPPRSEQDPEAWWLALQAAMEQCGLAAGEVAAISVAGQQHGMVALDAEGAAVHPAKLWNDTESAPQAARLVTEVGAAALAGRIGSVPGAAFTITKLAWLRDERPEAFGRVRRVLLPHDWLTWRLLGRPAHAITDRGDASGTGWWSPRAGTVDEELLRLVGARAEWVPEVRAPSRAVGDAATVVPGTLVGPGTGDNMGAALGLAVTPGELVVSLGTSGTAYALSASATCDASGAVAGFADATGRFLPLVCTANATKATDWALGLGGRRPEDLDVTVRAAPGTSPVAVLPYLDGERTPYRPDATGLVTGLTGQTTLAEIVRATLVGVVSSLLDGADRLTAQGATHGGPIRLVGGGARSHAYRQAVADLSQRPVVTAVDDREWVAYGAAAQAAACLHDADVAEQRSRWAPIAEEVTDPTMPASEAEALRRRHAALVEADGREA